MHRILLGISIVEFDATGQLLIMYSAFVKYLRKNGNKTKQRIRYLLTSRTYALVRRELLYNILVEFVISVKLVRLIKVCCNETFSRVLVGKHLSEMISIKNGLK
jgi:hypothetical protein